MHLTGSKSQLTFKSTYHSYTLLICKFTFVIKRSSTTLNWAVAAAIDNFRIIVRDTKFLFYFRLSMLKRIVDEISLPRAEEYFSMIIPAGHPLILIRTCLKYSKYLNYHQVYGISQWVQYIFGKLSKVEKIVLNRCKVIIC